MPESSQPIKPGTLYIVPTPLGNLADLSVRATDVLRQVDGIACEDTRRTLGLLNHLGFSKPLWSYHAHSSDRRQERLVDALREGKALALVSDAGTPGISDPGESLVQAVVDAGLTVVSLPGPCAAITALIASGLPTDSFFFIGFLPRRPARARRTLTQALATESTVILYESPFRVSATLQMIQTVAGPTVSVVIAREMTKIYEEYIRGTVAEVLARVSERDLKGEVVILFHAQP